MNCKVPALELHSKYKGKIEINSKLPLSNSKDLSLAYTPGVAEPCKAIKNRQELVYKYTCKGRFVAVVTDGSAVLGLGNIGPLAALPVMEGKALLFKKFAGVDAFPICIDSQDTDKLIQTVKLIAPGFGGINLEDISAPRCFEIEKRLKHELDIPVFHDDQHGTAVVVLAGIINSLKVVGKNIKEVRVVINGAGAAGVAITKLLLKAGVKDIVLCDSKGVIHKERKDLNWIKREMAQVTNKENIKGDLGLALKGKDIFIGVSVGNVVSKDMVETMAEDAVIFAMANPIPEIFPAEAKAGGAKVVGTGRSDFPNQINNVLAFPGIFKGALEVRAADINEQMKLAAAYAIADIIPDNELKPDYCIPDAFDKRIVANVASKTAEAAIQTNQARIKIDPGELKSKILAENIDKNL